MKENLEQMTKILKVKQEEMKKLEKEMIKTYKDLSEQKQYILNKQIFNLKFEVGFLQIKLGYYEQAERNLQNAKTIIEQKVPQNQLNLREWQLADINLKQNLAILYKKTKRELLGYQTLQKLLVQVNPTQFTKDGYVAYSQIEKIYLSAAKLSYFYHKYHETVEYAKTGIQICQQILEPKKTVFRQMKIIAKELGKPIKDKYLIWVKLYLILGKGLLQIQMDQQSQDAFEQSYKLCKQHYGEKDELTIKIKQKCQQNNLNTVQLKQKGNSLVVEGFLQPKLSLKQKIKLLFAPKATNILNIKNAFQITKLKTQKSSNFLKQDTVKSHRSLKRNNSNISTQFTEPTNAKFINLKKKFVQQNDENEKLQQIIQDIQKRDPKQDSNITKQIIFNNYLTSRPKSAKFKLSFDCCDNNLAYRKQDSNDKFMSLQPSFPSQATVNDTQVISVQKDIPQCFRKIQNVMKILKQKFHYDKKQFYAQQNQIKAIQNIKIQKTNKKINQEKYQLKVQEMFIIKRKFNQFIQGTQFFQFIFCKSNQGLFKSL